MRTATAIICSLSIFFISCNNRSEENLKANAVKEIENAEKEFAQMAAEKGIAESFGISLTAMPLSKEETIA